MAVSKKPTRLFKLRVRTRTFWHKLLATEGAYSVEGVAIQAAQVQVSQH